MNTPGHLRVLRIAAWIWIIYLASLGLVDLVIYSSRPSGDQILWYHLVNLVLAMAFVLLAYSGYLKRHVQLTTGFMVTLISATPILVQHFFNLRLPPAPLSNLEGMVLRQLPVLMIALVLVAWHYRLKIMVFYSVTLNLLEIIIVHGLREMYGERLMSFDFIIIVRMVCFIVVGFFINQLIMQLLVHQEDLKTANQQLRHYASTLETLTVARERNRMSRELHDTVVHTMSGLSVQLETTRAYLDVDADTSRRLIDQSLESTRSGLQETRRALKALRASPLDDLGLVMAIQKMLATAAERGKFSLRIDLPATPPVLPPDVEQCIFRLAQEAVENTVRHANAKNLTFQLTADSGDVEMVIRDDGIGFCPEEHPAPGHYGLSGMYERAQVAGGNLIISSHPNGGTTVRVAIKGYAQ